MEIRGINWNEVMEQFMPVLEKNVNRMDVTVAQYSISCYRVGEMVRIDIKDTE